MPDGHRINFFYWYSTISSSPHLKPNYFLSCLQPPFLSLRNSTPDFSILISSTISCHPTPTPGMYQRLSPCSIKLFLPSLSTTASLNTHYYMHGQLLSGLKNDLPCSVTPRALSKNPLICTVHHASKLPQSNPHSNKWSFPFGLFGFSLLFL